jgi:hypothetical protein
LRRAFFSRSAQSLKPLAALQLGREMNIGQLDLFRGLFGRGMESRCKQNHGCRRDDDEQSRFHDVSPWLI